MMEAQIERGVFGKWNSRHFWWLNVIARLKPGVSMEAAAPEVNLLWHQILANDPERKPAPSYDKDRDKRDRGYLMPGSGGYSPLRKSISKPLTVLMIVVGMVLLIACANVANLLLSRSAARQKEIAIRLAEGAGRRRLVSQLVTESLLIAVLGGIVGMGIAWWGTHVMIGFMPRQRLPLDFHFAPDFRILSFALAVSLLTGILCGLIPALLATRPDLTSSLKNETQMLGHTRFDLRRALVVVQVALSLLLLIGAGLFVRSLSNLKSLDPGFVRDRVLLVHVDPENSGYKGQRLRDFYERLLARVSKNPEARVASLAEITPLSGMRWDGYISVEGYQWRPDEKPFIDMNTVSPHFFETLGIPLLLGRDFREEDNPPFTPDPTPNQRPDDQVLGPPAPVAIINEAMAKHFFANQSPIGRRLTMGQKFDIANSFEIVGVVKDVRYFGVREAPESMMYVPDWRTGSSGRTLCVRTSGDPLQMTSMIRREAMAIDPAIPILQTLTLEQQFDDTISQERIVTTLCGFFGVLALLLAAIGLYGVMAHSVARRIREIGIRMALGARRGEVLWLILRDVAWMIGIGALIGLPAAFGLTRLVSSFLYGLTPQDPLSIAGSTLALIAITALAGYIPARRATAIDPMVALRHE
jgi:predicted permease